MPQVDIICFNLAHFPEHLREMKLSVLSSEEQQREAHFAFTHLRRRFAAAHLGLRLFLAKRLYPQAELQSAELLKTAANFKFELGSFGKPKLKCNSLAFNLSHSEDWAALALVKNEGFSLQPELGVDLEKISQRNALALAKRFFSQNEWQSLAIHSDLQERNQIFTRLWTRKEACLKLWGTGMHTPLNSFEVSSPLPIGLTSSSLPTPQCLYLQSTEVIENMYLSLALNFAPNLVKITLINWLDPPKTSTLFS